MNEHAFSHHSTPAPIQWPASLPDMLRYEDILLLIGRELDQMDAEAVTLSEVETGFLVRARCDGRASDLLEFQLADLALAVAEIRGVAGDTDQASELEEVPGGYAEFLRSLGQRLDLRQATYVVITEGTNFIALTGVEPTPGQESGRSFEEILLPDEIAHLIHSYTPTHHGQSGGALGTAPDGGAAHSPDDQSAVRRLFARFRR